MVVAKFSAALYSAHEFVCLVYEESMLSRLLILLRLISLVDQDKNNTVRIGVTSESVLTANKNIQYV